MDVHPPPTPASPAVGPPTPEDVDTWCQVGNALRISGKLNLAVEAFKRGLAVQPNHVKSLISLGNTLYVLREFKAAAESYLKALSFDPRDVTAYNNLGSALRLLGATDQAMTALRRSLFLNPKYNIAFCNLGNLLKDVGEVDEAVYCFRRALELKKSDFISHSNMIYTLYFHEGYDNAEILRQHLRYNAIHAVPLGRNVLPHANVPDPDRRLRIGYVSPDFRDHCQAFFTVDTLANHDHAKFEIYCYNGAIRPDAITEKIKACADTWCETLGMTDQDLASKIREDGIDVLVDLTMHMCNGRPLMFARKPAPVQVAWLAYPGTTGLGAMDWRLTDPYLDPPGDVDLAYVEKSYRLPNTFWCYNPLGTQPEPNELPALKNGHITFGCLNNFCKVTAPTLALWSRAMKAVPQSRLILLAPLGQHRQKLLERLQSLGIESARIEFVDFVQRPLYLRNYHLFDIGLDTLPYNGHTTSLDSYWMGVPVVTRVGNTVVGRAGWSQLSNLGLTELCAHGDEEFVDIVAWLCQDLPRLANLRATLRQRLTSSPLCNARQFTGDLESAYRQIWQHWCKQKNTE